MSYVPTNFWTNTKLRDFNDYNSWLNFMENNFVEGLENNIVLVLFYSGSQVYHPLYVIENNVVNSNLLWLPAANFKQLVLPMNNITLSLHSYDLSLQIHLCIGSCTIHHEILKAHVNILVILNLGVYTEIGAVTQHSLHKQM